MGCFLGRACAHVEGEAICAGGKWTGRLIAIRPAPVILTRAASTVRPLAVSGHTVASPSSTRSSNSGVNHARNNRSARPRCPASASISSAQRLRWLIMGRSYRAFETECRRDETPALTPWVDDLWVGPGRSAASTSGLEGAHQSGRAWDHAKKTAPPRRRTRRKKASESGPT
jgi:hypothetical protein